MRVAYFVNQYPAPSHTFIRREIQALEGHGIQVARFSLRSGDRLVDTDDLSELARTRQVLAIGPARLAWGVLRAAVTRPNAFGRAVQAALRLGTRSHRGLFRHAVYLAEACTLVRWFEEAKVEHVHAHFGTNSTAVALLCRTLGGPTYSFTVHGPEEFDMPESLKLGMKVQDAAFVVAIPDFGRSQLYRWSRMEDWGKIEVVRCAVDRRFLELPRTPTPTAPRLLHIGRLSEQKGQVLLLEALSDVARDGLDFQLTMIGDGPMREALQARAREVGLEGRVRFAGLLDGNAIRDETPRLQGARHGELRRGTSGRDRWKRSHAVVPSWRRASPGSRNSWSLACRAGSFRRVHGIRLAGAIRGALLASPEALDAMGEFGAARVAEAHDASREAAKLAALFRETVARNG